MARSVISAPGRTRRSAPTRCSCSGRTGRRRVFETHTGEGPMISPGHERPDASSPSDSLSLAAPRDRAQERQLEATVQRYSHTPRWPLRAAGANRVRQRISDRQGGDARGDASSGQIVGPRLHVPAVSATAAFRRPALAVGVELEGPAACAAMWCTAVRHLPGASQPQLRLVRLVPVAVAPASDLIWEHGREVGTIAAPSHRAPYAPSGDVQVVATRPARIMVISPGRENAADP